MCYLEDYCGGYVQDYVISTERTTEVIEDLLEETTSDNFVFNNAEYLFGA